MNNLSTLGTGLFLVPKYDSPKNGLNNIEKNVLIQQTL